ncbi:ATPase [Chryseobacterium sp. Leaf404]|uniref:SRPBCC family protein n=1 Tax=unclassified Chryseobacterium TaxID=2593645 RepID=UPI0006FBCAFE|nr:MULTISPECIES: SRPBCC domain-containing protein [unclassified Chryseobacterium]KQT17519.1 ATPase [Chryseobacterium sp. Leaf404]
METLDYEIIINAPKEKVWDALFASENYGQWTQFFSPGSQMKTDWQVNGKTYFVNQEGAGMVSTIGSLEKPNQVVFKHLGMVDKDGVEDTESMEIKQWSGCSEKYFLIDYDAQTKLHVEVQVEKEWEEHIATGFTKGLEVVKKIAEGN